MRYAAILISHSMNSIRFTELLSLYLDGKATREERRELMQLIHEGTHDETIKERIDAMLLHEAGPEALDSAKARKILKSITEQEDDKVIPIQRSFTNWSWVAAAAVLLVCVGIGWWSFETALEPEQPIALKEKEPQNFVFSGRQFIRLPDGSTVLLNDGTELRYGSSFGKLDREVTLSGEGFFDVRHNASMPFKVLTGKVTTTVLGTAFNVKAYPGQEEIRVTVTRGRVQVKDDQRTLGIITPDQQIAVHTATRAFVKAAVEAEAEVAWQKQYLIFDDVSLEEAVKTIGRRYKVRISLDNEQLSACRISATFLDGENLDQVLTVVTGVVHATYTTLPDGTVKIEGQGCK